MQKATNPQNDKKLVKHRSIILGSLFSKYYQPIEQLLHYTYNYYNYQAVVAF